MRIKTAVLTVLGFLFLGLGAVGLLVPVWPTTPFVLLSAACFSSTPRLKEGIMKIGFFREHIENYEKRCGLSRKTLVVSLIYLWGMLLLSMLLSGNTLIICLLLTIGVAVTIHILWVSKDRGKKNINQGKVDYRRL